MLYFCIVYNVLTSFLGNLQCSQKSQGQPCMLQVPTTSWPVASLTLTFYGVNLSHESTIVGIWPQIIIDIFPQNIIVPTSLFLLFMGSICLTNMPSSGLRPQSYVYLFGLNDHSPLNYDIFRIRHKQCFQIHCKVVLLTLSNVIIVYLNAN